MWLLNTRNVTNKYNDRDCHYKTVTVIIQMLLGRLLTVVVLKAVTVTIKVAALWERARLGTVEMASHDSKIVPACFYFLSESFWTA